MDLDAGVRSPARLVIWCGTVVVRLDRDETLVERERGEIELDPALVVVLKSMCEQSQARLHLAGELAWSFFTSHRRIWGELRQ